MSSFRKIQDFKLDIQTEPNLAVAVVKYTIEYPRQAPQGVVVHQTQHFDTPQVIVNPYGNYPLDANRIDQDWVNQDKTNIAQAKSIAKDLRVLAKRLEKMAKDSPIA